ncbi:unnamed protein product [Calypogeia fissa]
MEVKDRHYFWVYPLCFDFLIRLDSSCAMYPGEGANTLHAMTPSEFMHCPWYIDSNRWGTPFNLQEVADLRIVEKRGEPLSFRLEAKVQLEGNLEEFAKAVESNMSSFPPGKTRPEKQRNLTF